jgi:hypothetical protein
MNNTIPVNVIYLDSLLDNEKYVDCNFHHFIKSLIGSKTNPYGDLMVGVDDFIGKIIHYTETEAYPDNISSKGLEIIEILKHDLKGVDYIVIK